MFKNEKNELFGAIEAGGTKFNCVIASKTGDIKSAAKFSTETPTKTLMHVSEFFNNWQTQHGSLKALGIASFGPVDLDKNSSSYGYITNTPKSGWSNVDIAGYFKDKCNLPIAFETDVNGAAWGELVAGGGRGCKSFIYVTVGTGIGAGIIVDGKLLQGISHPEVGHMLIPCDRNVDSYFGCCPFHGGCLEGLASGTAINNRWKINAQHLPDNHPAWQLEAYYLAHMCVNLTNIFSPEKIILGGGVMEQKQLFPLIHEKFIGLMNGYGPATILNNVDAYIVPSYLHGQAGILGALDLAVRVNA